MDIEIGGETFHKETNLLEQIAYRDTWGRGADSFISMIYERLILMRDLMADGSSIYVHMGPNVSYAVEAAIREVFGGPSISPWLWLSTLPSAPFERATNRLKQPENDLVRSARGRLSHLGDLRTIVAPRVVRRCAALNAQALIDLCPTSARVGQI